MVKHLEPGLPGATSTNLKVCKKGLSSCKEPTYTTQQRGKKGELYTITCNERRHVESGIVMAGRRQTTVYLGEDARREATMSKGQGIQRRKKKDHKHGPSSTWKPVNSPSPLKKKQSSGKPHPPSRNGRPTRSTPRYLGRLQHPSATKWHISASTPSPLPHI